MNVKQLLSNNLRGDIFGGLTAAVVALPLALAFGVASGAGAVAGIYGAIIVGMFAAVFGGTPAQISGPTGPMTVVMAIVIANYMQQYPEDGMALAFTVVMMAGIIQILFGLLRLGKYIILVPYPVISGFMSGIGIIIIVMQTGPLFGHEVSSSIIQSFKNVPLLISAPNYAALSLSLLTLSLLTFWPNRLNRVLPAPLVALITGTALYLLLFNNADIPRIGEIPSGLPSLHWPTLNMSIFKDMLYSATLLAALGSIDSLLTSLVADNLTRKHHDSDKELIGQGIGNMIAGAFGAIPGAGATMRTVVNIHAGGRTPVSGVLHSLILLIIILGAGTFAKNIPNAVLAGILVKVGIDIIDWRFLKRVHRLPLFSGMLMCGVLLLTVFVDLITAVVAGAFVANMVTISRLTHVQLDGIRFSTSEKYSTKLTEAEKEILRQSDNRILLFELSGPMSFGIARVINQQLAEFQSHEVLIIDFSHAVMVGITTSMVIEDLIEKEQQTGRDVYLVGIHEEIDKKFTKLDIYKRVPANNQFKSNIAALEKAALAINYRT